MEEEIINATTFWTLIEGKKKKAIEAKFDGQSFFFTLKNKTKIIDPEDLVNIKLEDSALIIHYVEIKRAKWRLKNINLWHENQSELTKWERCLNSAANPYLTDRPKRLLVFVNPYGGKGKANKVYKTKAEPVFKAAGIECRVVETQSATHASQVILDDVALEEDYDGVVAVGGDGMFNQVFDALIRRKNKETFEKIRAF